MLNWNTKTVQWNMYQKCRLQNDGNSGRAALRHHIGLLCTTILRGPEPMPPFRLLRRVSNLLTHHGRCAAQGPSLAVCSPPSSWLADKSCLPRISGELRGQQPGVVLDCCRGSGSYTWLRIHTSVWWGNNSLTNNVMLIYTTIKENNIYSNTFRCW